MRGEDISRYVIEPKAAAKERQIMDVAMLWYYRQQEQLEAREKIEQLLDAVTDWAFAHLRESFTGEEIAYKIDEIKRGIL